MLRRCLISCLLLLLGCQVSLAEPWVGRMEKSLHQDLVLLAEQGVLHLNVTTFPVPWKGVSSQLSQLDLAALSEEAQLAVARLQHYLRSSRRPQRRWVELSANSEKPRFVDVNPPSLKTASVQFNHQFNRTHWAGQLSAGYTSDGKIQWDDSFLAYQYAGWTFWAGQLDQWWGPGQAASLILTDSARPAPALGISRASATRSSHPWLALLGPWYFTSQMAVLERQRYVPRTRLWRSRFTVQPIKNLELGFNWAVMWGGEGQPNGWRDFIDVVTSQTQCANGEPQCDSSLYTKIGNQLAGYDLRYSFTAFDLPMTVYAQQIGEDAVDTYSITDKASLFGMSVYLEQIKWFVEWSDTNVACNNDGSQAKNCFYEHSTYQSGYRYYDRAMGSTFDSDATVVSLGAERRFTNGDAVQIRLHYADLNKDGRRPSPLIEGQMEQLILLNGQYQHPVSDWLVTLSMSLQRNKVDQTETNWDGRVGVSAKYYW